MRRGMVTARCCRFGRLVVATVACAVGDDSRVPGGCDLVDPQYSADPPDEAGVPGLTAGA